MEVWQARSRRAARVSGLLVLALCAVGMAQAFSGLDVGEACLVGDGQDFDLAYWAAHRSDSVLPPYSSPCNARYDRVPGWVNPAIALAAGACTASLAALAAFRVVRWARARA